MVSCCAALFLLVFVAMCCSGDPSSCGLGRERGGRKRGTLALSTVIFVKDGIEARGTRGRGDGCGYAAPFPLVAASPAG